VFPNVIINENVAWGAEYLTTEGGKHEDRNGTRERGRRGILGMRWRG